MLTLLAPPTRRLPVLHPASPPRPPRLADRHGRTIGYLRLSLTRGCSMRCVYCRPAFDRNPRDEVRLTPAEIERVVRHLVARHGLHKVRLTGGDPTARPDLVEVLRRVASIAGVRDLAMTTNGLTLARDARALAEAGLQRVNVSLDTLDSEQFRRLTGVDGLHRVLAGLDAARAAGLGPIKINTVVIRDENDAGLPALLDWSAAQGYPLRLIELMPMGPLADLWRERFVSEAAMRRRLAGVVQRYEPLEQGADAARRYRVLLRDGRRAELGFITPMSCRFCGACDRLRLGADGTIYPCLMDRPRGTLLPAIRPVFDGMELHRRLTAAYADKAAEHPDVGPAIMTHVGG